MPPPSVISKSSTGRTLRVSTRNEDLGLAIADALGTPIVLTDVQITRRSRLHLLYQPGLGQTLSDHRLYVLIDLARRAEISKLNIVTKLTDDALEMYTIDTAHPRRFNLKEK